MRVTLPGVRGAVLWMVVEEIGFLRAAGIPYEVPGITAAVAAAAYAELPLTRRRQASSVAVCTGHTEQVAVPKADYSGLLHGRGAAGGDHRAVAGPRMAPRDAGTLIRNSSRPGQSVDHPDAEFTEKVVAAVSGRYVTVVDESRLVPRLGTRFPVPVEVVPPALAPVRAALHRRGYRPEVRIAVRKQGPVIAYPYYPYSRWLTIRWGSRRLAARQS